MSLDRRQFLTSAAALSQWPAATAQRGITADRASGQFEATDRVLRSRVPDHFLGFNLNSITLELQYWDETRGRLHQDLLQTMATFPGAIYRYPGGLIANTFNWEWATGPMSARRPQKGAEWAKPAAVRFGPREYFEFLRAVGGRSWYTLNLVGWSPDRLNVELPSTELAESNGRLARLRAAQDPTRDLPRYYQFGNELDRSHYEWPTEKYIARARESMSKVLAADPSARFVPFLRDFDWTYKQRGGRSRAEDFAANVLNAMPEVEDYSLQIYYDRASEEGHAFDISWRLRLIDEIMARAQHQRERPLRVWITEHAKAKPQRVPSQDLRLASTSGINGAIASADFCLAMLERPAVQAALWHALGGGAWWDLFRFDSDRLLPTPVLEVMRMWRPYLEGEVVALRTVTSNLGRYPGGYDLRASLLRVAEKATLLVVNRAPVPGDLVLLDRSLTGRTFELQLESVAAARSGDRLEDEMSIRHVPAVSSRVKIGGDSQLLLAVPARSVSVARLSRISG